MNCILHCKIFSGLDPARQHKILTALQDPMNTTLVQQLSKYLSEDIDDISSSPIQDEEIVEDNKDTDDISKEINHTDSGSKISKKSVEPHLNNSTQSNNSSSVKQPEDDDNVNDDSVDDNANDNDKIEDDNDTVNSSVNASCCICSPTIAIDTEIIKGTLNSRQDTSEVSQIRLKEENPVELWIYYKDTVNLNNIMPAVIDVMYQIDPHIEFNRLARSNNAIVFDIVCGTTSQNKENNSES